MRKEGSGQVRSAQGDEGEEEEEEEGVGMPVTPILSGLHSPSCI